MHARYLHTATNLRTGPLNMATVCSIEGYNPSCHWARRTRPHTSWKFKAGTIIYKSSVNWMTSKILVHRTKIDQPWRQIYYFFPCRGDIREPTDGTRHIHRFPSYGTSQNKTVFQTQIYHLFMLLVCQENFQVSVASRGSRLYLKYRAIIYHCYVFSFIRLHSFDFPSIFLGEDTLVKISIVNVIE